MTDTEILEAMRQMLEPVNLKLENIDNRLTNLEYENQKHYRELKQDTETIMAVLEARNLLPKALYQQNPRLYAGDTLRRK